MEISIALQTLVFLRALFLGAALGTLYDALRAVRRTVHAGASLTAVLDGAFWAIALLALFVFVLAAANGEARGYILLGGALGAVLYFFTCSPPLLAVFCVLARACVKAVEIPTVLWKKTRECALKRKKTDIAHKKMKKYFKNLFHFR